MIYQSTCGHCSRPGIVSTDQRSGPGGNGGRPLASVRFWCTCGHIWMVDREPLEQHSAFLERTGLA